MTRDEMPEVATAVAGVTALHFTAAQLYEWAGILAGMAVLFYLRRSGASVLQRTYYVAASGLAGVVITWAAGDFIHHFFPWVPDSAMAMLAFLAVMCSLPLVTIWRHWWTWMMDNPNKVASFVRGIIPWGRGQ